MGNKISTRPTRKHCNKPMLTWRNTRWVTELKEKRPFRHWYCFECGHQEKAQLTP